MQSTVQGCSSSHDHVTSLSAGSQLSENHVGDHGSTLPSRSYHCTDKMHSSSREHYPTSHMTGFPTGRSPLPSLVQLKKTRGRDFLVRNSSASSVDMILSPSKHFSDDKENSSMNSAARARAAVVQPLNFKSVPPPNFNSVPPPNFNSVPSPNFNSVPPKFNSVPPPKFDSVPPPKFNSVPPNFNSILPSTREGEPFLPRTRVRFPSAISTISSNSTTIAGVPSSIYLTPNISSSGNPIRREQKDLNPLKVDKCFDVQSSLMDIQLGQNTGSGGLGSGGSDSSLMEPDYKEKVKFQVASPEVAMTSEPLPPAVTERTFCVEKRARPNELQVPSAKTSVLVDSCTQTFNCESRAIQTEDEVAPISEVEQRICQACRKNQDGARVSSALIEDASVKAKSKNSSKGGGNGVGILSHEDPLLPRKISCDTTLLLHDLLPSADTRNTGATASCAVQNDLFGHMPISTTQSLVATSTVDIGSDTLLAASLLNPENTGHEMYPKVSSRCSMLEQFSMGYHTQGKDDYNSDHLDGAG